MQLQNRPRSLDEHQQLSPRSTQPYDIWASEHLEDFAGQMALNGIPVSCVRLRNDASYTLLQLATAHAADDATLREMAMTLFRQFERNRSGIPLQFSD